MKRSIGLMALTTFVLMSLPSGEAAADEPEAAAPPASPAPPVTPDEPRPASTYRNALAFDLGQHVVGVGLQRTDSPWVSVQGVIAYYQPWTQNINFLGISGDADKGGDLRGAILRARAFIYPWGTAPTGFWVTPFVQAGIGFGLRDGVRKSGAVGAAGLSIGYTGRITERVLLGGGLGLQYHYAYIPDGSGPPSFSRFYPQVEIHAAYMF